MSVETRSNGRSSMARAVATAAKNFCIGFTVFMLFSMALGMVFAPEESKVGIVICWEIALAILCAVALQAIFFTPYVIKRMAYVTRLVLFGICLYVVLAICGVFFAWFPADNVWALLSFTIAYLVILAIMTLVFSLIYRRDLQALNKGLEDFKAKGR